MNYFYKNKKHRFYFGILRKFQGFGFMTSFDHVMIGTEYVLIEFKFLWISCFYSYDYKNI